ncbi:hypothetical protein BJ322DRAFT_1025354 [Thelephora terrestris]|uniref:BAG domain-containing protein n=1 Tax=Thelephora terrestris TaxID=56493 RepID=A0A9P6L0I5_9AGAM|nr:hypothetical protein BJ322DRAFT_1025354 [Thelephora terrestris]
MSSAIPETSTLRPTLYSAPQSYEYLPSQGYYTFHEAPRLVVEFSPSHHESFPFHQEFSPFHQESSPFHQESSPFHQGFSPFYQGSSPFYQDFFPSISAEELEEREYQRALEVVANYRRRQAEKEAAAARRQELAEAARQRHTAALATGHEQRRQAELDAARRAELTRSQQARARLVAAELQRHLATFSMEREQRQQSELLAARRAEITRSQQARARMVAAERQQALSAIVQQLKGPQPATHQSHAVERKSLADALKQGLAAGSNSGITGSIGNNFSAFEPRPVEPEKSKVLGEDHLSKCIEGVFSSIFPALASHAQSEPAPSTEKAQSNVPDKGKGKARAEDIEEPKQPETSSETVEGAFADMLRHVMALSKSTPAPRSADGAGPSGSPLYYPAKPSVAQTEQAQVDRAIALSAVEHIQNTLTKLQTEFVLPTEFDHYAPSTDERDETASVSSSDLTKLIPYTHTNKPVYKYENELQGLLEELDRIDSHGDSEVRARRKAVVGAVEKALEGVGHVVGEAVEKRLSLVSTSAPAAPEESLKGFDVDNDVTVPTHEQVVVDNATIPAPLTQVLAEETVISSAGVHSLVDEAIPETEIPTVTGTTADLPVGQTSPESDVEASTATITPGSVNPRAEPEAEPTGSQARSDTAAIADTVLAPEEVSPPSPVLEPKRIDSDTEDGVLSLDSDAERSDWSEVER